MGKMKTKRAALHTKAAKVPEITITPPSVSSTTPITYVPSQPTNLDGIFSKVDIDLNAMSRDMPGKDFDDRKSGITSKSLRGMNLKKTEKMKMRKEFFMKSELSRKVYPIKLKRHNRHLEKTYSTVCDI